MNAAGEPDTGGNAMDKRILGTGLGGLGDRVGVHGV
jgi:hypothetical protein